MSDDLERRLAAYGDVLRQALADEAAGSDVQAGTSWSSAEPPATPADETNVIPLTPLLVTPPAPESRRNRRRMASIVGIAAAVLALIAFAAPMALPDRAPVTVAGSGFADQAAANELALDGPAGEAGLDEMRSDDAATDTPATDEGAPLGDDEVPEIAAFVDTDTEAEAEAEAEADRGTRADAGSEADAGSATDDVGEPTDAATADEPTGAAAADESTDAPDGDPTEGAAAIGTEDDDKPADEPTSCTDLHSKAIEHDGRCWLVGAPPAAGTGSCPADAIALGDQCFLEVPASCGDSPAVSGGCLGPVSNGTTGTTTKATATCGDGRLVGDRCLVEVAKTGGPDCIAGLTLIGNGCYQLTDPTVTCAEGQLVDGTCKVPVASKTTTQCPAGYEQWNTLCYRYEPASVSCASGQLVDGAWCKVVTDATPGPETCGEYQQDASGCYWVSPPNGDGGCGDLPPIEGGCRYPKPSQSSWTCNGEVVWEPTCWSYVEATVACASGRVVDGPKCKIEVEATVETGCPEWATQVGDSCWKYVDPVRGCGSLDQAPDGVHCKTWVAAPTGGTCGAGFEATGDSCKKWYEPTWTCADGALSFVAGAPTCTGTTSTCIGTGVVEHGGQCHLVVAADCGDLDPSPWKDGHCKKPAERTGATAACADGHTRIGDRCLKPLSKD